MLTLSARPRLPFLLRIASTACAAICITTVAATSTPAIAARATAGADMAAQGTSRPAASQITQPCGNAGTPGQVQHVIWIWMENESYANVIGNSNAPYQTSLAKQCGTPTNFHNESHGSLNNYIAATSGQNILGTSFINDCTPNPSANYCVNSGPSIFSETQGAGETWRSYAEDMPSNCYQGTSGNYIAQHNPAVYYTSLTTCGQYDVPMGSAVTHTGQFYSDLASGNLPAFSFITPNLVDDSHSSSTATADTWLSQIVPLITGGPNYQSGDTVLFITNDEGIGSDYTLNENCTSQALDASQPSCLIPTIVVAPHVPAGTVDNTFYTHYSMLRTTEELLGLPQLGLAASANSMTSNFNLGAVSGSLAPPSAPTNLTVTATSSGQVDLSWTAAIPGGAAISGYQISRNGTVIDTAASTATTYADATAGPGMTYSYAVSAVDSAGNVSGPSNSVSVTTPAAANLLTNPGFETWSGGLPAGWTTYGAHTTLTHSSDARSGSSSVLIATTTSGYASAGLDDGATPTVDSTVAGTTYTASCWVKASKSIPITVQLAERQHNFTLVSPRVTTTLTVPTTTSWYQLSVSDTATGNGNMMPFYTFTNSTSGGGATFEADDCSLSAGSTTPPPDTTPPSVPTGLSAKAAGSAQVNLTWNAAADNVGVAGYDITRDGVQVGSTTGATSYGDTGLSPGTTYSYAVIAFDAAGNKSAASAGVSVTTPAVATPPSAPANLTASAASASQVNLTWVASAAGSAPIAGYQVTCNGVLLATAAGTTYSDTGASPGTTYTCTVSAIDANGVLSGPSNSVSVTTPAAANLLTNPGFETWSGGLPAGWTTYGAHTTLTHSSDARSGSSSVLIATTTSGYASAGLDDGATPTVDSTVAGTTYTASCWVKASKSIPITVQLAERQHNFTLVSPRVTTTLTVPTTTSWYQLSVSDTATGNGNMMPFYTFTNSTSGGGATFEADDCSLSAAG